MVSISVSFSAKSVAHKESQNLLLSDTNPVSGALQFRHFIVGGIYEFDTRSECSSSYTANLFFQVLLGVRCMSFHTHDKCQCTWLDLNLRSESDRNDYENCEEHTNLIILRI